MGGLIAFLLSVGFMAIPAVLLWAAGYALFRNSLVLRLLFSIGALAMLTFALGPFSLLSVPISLLGTVPFIIILDWAYRK